MRIVKFAKRTLESCLISSSGVALMLLLNVDAFKRDLVVHPWTLALVVAWAIIGTAICIAAIVPDRGDS